MSPARTYFIRYRRSLHRSSCATAHLAPSLLIEVGMRAGRSPTPERIQRTVQAHLNRRLAEVMSPAGAAQQIPRFSWCGDLFDYLVKGVDEKLASIGITLRDPYPGPMNLWDEDQHPDGSHVRRFWTVALERGCPIARICTFFFHRHDRVELPKPPRVLAFPPDRRDQEAVR